MSKFKPMEGILMTASLEHLKELMDKYEPDNSGYFDEVGEIRG